MDQAARKHGKDGGIKVMLAIYSCGRRRRWLNEGGGMRVELALRSMATVQPPRMKMPGERH